MTTAVNNRLSYAGLVVLNLVIGALLVQIGNGSVPISKDWQWVVPILLALLNGVAMFLPRVGHEDVAQLVDSVGHANATAALQDTAVAQATGTQVQVFTPEQIAQLAEALHAPVAADLEQRMRTTTLATAVSRGDQFQGVG